jgi:type 1 fimbriae regulatory protein FimB/type 1 fimbriae regulatory protein FimE
LDTYAYDLAEQLDKLDVKDSVMVRHATGYKLANDGQHTRAIRHYLGHRNIQHTTRYTELAPDRVKNFWRN